MPLQELFEWQEHLSEHSVVLYPVRGKGQRAVEAIFFGLSQLQQPLAYASADSLRNSLAQYASQHWQDLSQMHGPVQQQTIQSAVCTGNWDQASSPMLLAAAAQMCVVQIKLHPVDCACCPAPQRNRARRERTACPASSLLLKPVPCCQPTIS